jgi:hypothetical protein
MYGISAVIASFLRKMQHNVAQSRGFSFHTTKHFCDRTAQNECALAIGWRDLPSFWRLSLEQDGK